MEVIITCIALVLRSHTGNCSIAKRFFTDLQSVWPGSGPQTAVKPLRTLWVALVRAFLAVKLHPGNGSVDCKCGHMENEVHGGLCSVRVTSFLHVITIGNTGSTCFR